MQVHATALAAHADDSLLALDVGQRALLRIHLRLPAHSASTSHSTSHASHSASHSTITPKSAHGPSRDSSREVWRCGFLCTRDGLELGGLAVEKSVAYISLQNASGHANGGGGGLISSYLAAVDVASGELRWVRPLLLHVDSGRRHAERGRGRDVRLIAGSTLTEQVGD
jgi:hypothetical protein